MEPTGEHDQPVDDIVIQTAGLSDVERELAYSVAKAVAKPIFDALAALAPSVRPYALAVGVAQASDVINRQRVNIFGPGPSARALGEPGDPTPVRGNEYFELLNKMQLSDDEVEYAADVTVKLLQVAIALDGSRPGHVRPFAILAGMAEAVRNMELTGKWGPEKRLPGMPGPDGKPMAD
jgi:hypothetical protein